MPRSKELNCINFNEDFNQLRKKRDVQLWDWHERLEQRQGKEWGTEDKD